MIRGALVLLVAMQMGACRPPRPQPPPQPVDGGTYAAEPCSEACGILSSLHCPEGEPTAKGESCTSVCGNASRLVPAYRTAISCVQKAPTLPGRKSTLDAVQDCGVCRSPRDAGRD